jgi:hypothetical protein
MPAKQRKDRDLFVDLPFVVDILHASTTGAIREKGFGLLSRPSFLKASGGDATRHGHDDEFFNVWT